MLEGYLLKWINIISGWKPRYFILHHGLLITCEKKGGKQEGVIYIPIASVFTIKEDPRRIIVRSAAEELHIRAHSVEETSEWYQALRQEQEGSIHINSMKEYHDVEIASAETRLSPEIKEITRNINIDPMKEDLTRLWVCQAEFNEVLSTLSSKVRTNPDLKEHVTRLERLGETLKVSIENR